MSETTLKPIEFIDFNNLPYLPNNTNRRGFRDPLAIDIKEEPIIKEEPVDNWNENTLDENHELQIKQEPPDVTDYNVCNIMETTARILKEESIDLEVSQSSKKMDADLIPTMELSKKDRLLSSDITLTKVNSDVNTIDVEKFLELESREVITFCQLSQNMCTGKRGGQYSIKSLYLCYHCDYFAFMKTHIRVHIIAKHGGRKPYSCRLCKLRFTQKGNLNYHNKSVHMKLKPYQCDKCDFTCSRKEDVRRHFSAVHDTFKPFECDECTYKTTRITHLNSHVKAVHRKVKPFLCALCEYAASRKTHLKNHIAAKHSRIKKHVCTECNYKATQKSLLIRHISIYHQTNNCKKKLGYKCHYCHISTRNKSILKKHISMKHSTNFII